MRSVGREHQAHADLAVRGLAGAARVLALHARRELPLLQKAGVVDDPRANRAMRGHRADSVACGVRANGCIRPRRCAEEVNESLVHRMRALRGSAHSRRDRLHALAFAVREQSERVHRKRSALAFVPQKLANTVEERAQRIIVATCIGLHLAV